MKKRTNGFTLLEMMLVVAVMSIMIAATYTVYNRMVENQKIDKQIRHLYEISESLDNYFLGFAAPSGTPVLEAEVNPPTTLITNRLIPADMVATSSSLKNLWGGPAIINGVLLDITPSDGVSNTLNSYQVTLNNIPAAVCAKLGGHPSMIKFAQRIIINGSVVKNPGVPNINVGTLAAACIDGANTIAVAREAYKGENPLETNPNRTGVRTKESKYFIPPTGTATTTLGTPSCGGGSSWDATISSCVCPSSTVWNGKTCGATGATGYCQMGELWNSNTKLCQPLCAANQRFHPLTKLCVAHANPSTTKCIPGLDPTNPETPASVICQSMPNKVVTVPTFQAGRNIPANTLASVAPIKPSIPTTTSHTAQITSSMAATNAAAGALNCAVGNRPTYALPVNHSNGSTYSVPVANFDGKVCQMCINGVWDQDRCVAR